MTRLRTARHVAGRGRDRRRNSDSGLRTLAHFGGQATAGRAGLALPLPLRCPRRSLPGSLAAMPRGGAANLSQRGVLIWSLLAAPACGLVVGFEPRELCDDCSDSTSEGDGASGGGGSTSGAGGADASSGPNSTNSDATTDASIAPDNTSSTGSSDSGGAGESNTDVGETTSSGGGEGGNGGMGNGGAGDGGSDTLSSSTEGSNTGGGSTDGTGSGGTGTEGASTSSATAGGNGGTEASGSDTVSSTTSVGGTGNASTTGGSGGGGGSPLCEVETTFDASETEGVYPSAIMLGRNNSVRPWELTWVENDEVYVSARANDETVVLAPTRLDDGGAHDASAIATQGAYAFVAYGEYASGDATVVMNRLSPVAFGEVTRGATDALGSDAAPRVLGIAMQGSSNRALVAALDAENAGVLTLFDNGTAGAPQLLLGPIAALAPFDLEEHFGLAYIDEGSLKLSLVDYESGDVAMLDDIPDAAPIASSPHSLGAAAMNNGAALVWEQADGIYLTTLDTDGDPAAPVRVSRGQNDILPRVDVMGAQLFVSWIDADAHELYLTRYPTGLAGAPEPRLEVAQLVADSSYGLAADRFSVDTTLALVYATERLKLSIISCP